MGSSNKLDSSVSSNLHFQSRVVPSPPRRIYFLFQKDLVYMSVHLCFVSFIYFAVVIFRAIICYLSRLENVLSELKTSSETVPHECFPRTF